MAEILQEKTITFDSRGGSSVPSQKLYMGECVTRPADTYKSDFTFLNWYEDNETLKLYDFNYIPTKDMTLYAKWEPIPAFTSVDQLAEFLAKQPENNPSNSYKVRLNIDDEDEIERIRVLLEDNPNKYVSLDLSGSTITYIPSHSSGFRYCTNLTSINIPDSVTEIWEYAFDGCTGLTNITIPDSVIGISEMAFGGCTSLTNITIGSGVDNIERYAFHRCTNLIQVIFQRNTIDNFSDNNSFPGDLRDKYRAGGIGTYTKSNDNTWTKQSNP